MRARTARRDARRPSGLRRGLALLVVLAVTVVLVSLAIHFHQLSSNRLRLARNFEGRYRALNLARSGILLAEETLLMDKRRYYAGVLPPPEEGGPPVEEEYQEVDALYRMFDASTRTPFPFDNGRLSIRLEDEDARLNLNRTDTYSTQFLYNLLETLGVRKEKDLLIYGATVQENRNQEMAHAVADWIDPDSAVSPGGAEDPYYGELPVPYQCRNSFLQCPEELVLIRDFDLPLLTGAPPRKADAEDGQETLDDDAGLASLQAGEATEASTTAGGLLAHVSIFGTTYRVNVNTASQTVLGSIPGVFESPQKAMLVEVILRNRPYRSFAELAQVVQSIDPTAWHKMTPYCNVTSDYFRVRATGFVGAARVTVEAVLRKMGARTHIVSWRQT